MARKLSTAQITATSGYPLIGDKDGGGTGHSGLDFLQLMNDERFDAIIQFLGGLNLASVTSIWGAVVTIVGGNYSVTEGWVYYNSNPGHGSSVGEMFYVAPVASTSMGGYAYLSASISDNADADDPIQYSDGTNNSPHRVRTVSFAPSATPSTGTLPDANGWLTIGANPLIVGGTGVAYATGISQFNRLAYWINNNIVNIEGDFTATSASIGFGDVGSTFGESIILFVLPANMRPKNYVYGIAMETSGSPGSSPFYKTSSVPQYMIIVCPSGRVIMTSIGGSVYSGSCALSIPSFSVL